MKKFAWLTWIALTLACTDDAGDEGTMDTGSTDPSGDGDPGDGDPGDGDPGDGDPGDGDPGDGDPGDGDGDPGGLEPELVSLVAPTPGNGAVGVGHCAIAPNGDIYVTWLQQEGADTDIFLTRSTDGGQSFEARVGVEDGPDTPVGGFNAARRPYVATDGARVAVVYGSVPEANYSGLRISTSLTPLTLGPLIEVGTPDANVDFEDFQKPTFSPDGNVWVVWHKSLIGVSEGLALSREENGWTPEDLTGGTPGEPCECCPLDVRVNGAGDVLVAYRNNIDNIRDQFVLRAPGGGAFGPGIPGSSTNWFVPACPLDGPRLTETAGGTQLLTWSDPTSGESRIWLAESDDDGASWSGDHLVLDQGGAQETPSITTAAGGRVWVTFAQGNSGRLTASDDDGQSFAPAIPVTTADGDLVRMELCSGPTQTGLVGTSPSGSLWWAGF